MSHKRYNRFNWNKRKRDSTPESRSIRNKKNLKSPAHHVQPTPTGSSNSSEDPVTYNLDRQWGIYYGWKLYFSDEEYSEDSLIMKNIQAMEEFVERHHESFSVEKLETGIPYNIDINTLYNDETFSSNWSSFKSDMMLKPRETLNCLGLAIHQSIINRMKNGEDANSIDDIAKSIPMIRPQILNYGPVILLKDLKLRSYGRLMSIRGCIIRVGSVKRIAQWITFSCARCGINKSVKQPEGIYTLPRKCDACNTKKFNPVLDSPHTKCVIFHVVRMQEDISDAQNERGRIPRILDVELIEDLVDTCMPGDDVTVTGIIKADNAEDGPSKKNVSNEFSLCMEAICVMNNKQESQNNSGVVVQLNVKDYMAINEVHDEPNLFRLLVHSLCPGIYGHEMIKAGLILSLFGGSTKHTDSREDIHVLIVGDPGIGKSQMLKACARVAPKGVYICGNSSTSAGLTVTLMRENGDFSLEPGALVLADKGCCCIDEFDKMATQHQALLEAMEQQSVSLAKSGIVCTLPARTSILAAANPQGGRYNKAKTIKENLHMSQPLLSRFDLIFILLDQPNEQIDSLLSKHVMALHAGMNSQDRNEKSAACSSSLPRSFAIGGTLREKLSVSATEAPLDIIPQSIIRKYISYARQYVRPVISIPATHVLYNFYLKFRKENKTQEKVSTCRQLEALIRLTEARAKLELREEATENDALEVIQLIRYTMEDVSDDIICHDLSTSGKITRNKIQAFMKLLKNESTHSNTENFTIKELQDVARRGNVMIDDFINFITILNEQGYLLKKATNLYKLCFD